MSSSFVGEAGTRPDDVPFGEKMEDKDWLERSDHPLLNDVILNLLFGHVRRLDLKTCRRVCKKWNEQTIPYMRSTFQVTIHGDESQEDWGEENDHRIVDFVKLFKTNVLGIPFGKYRVGPFDTTDGAGKQFLEICGDTINEIVLFQPYDLEYARTIKNVSDLLKSSSKLEALTISGQFIAQSGKIVKLFPDSTPVLSTLKKLTVKHDSSESPIKCCPTFFDELLSVATNISNISIDDKGHVTKPDSCLLCLLLNSIEKLGRESSIQSLPLKSNPSREHIEILKRLAEKPNGLKLKKISFESYFSFTGPGPNRRPTVEIQLATIFKDSLEHFNVIGGYHGINLMEFPNMPKLKSFNFSVLDGHKPVDLNQIFPVIETLNTSFEYPIIDSGSDNDSESDTSTIGSDDVNELLPEEFFSEFQVCPTMKTLILNEKVTNLGSFRNILRVFPNLRKLSLTLGGGGSEQVIKQIWNMTQLESLSLVGCIDSKNQVMKLDSIVTGISIEGLNKIRHVIPDLEKMTKEERREKILNLVEELNTQEPSIRNLTNMRYLKLGVNVGWGSICNLSDLTGYFGIYLMKRLNHLDIERCEFTKTCCEILTRDTGVEAWSFQTGRMGSKYIIRPCHVPRAYY